MDFVACIKQFADEFGTEKIAQRSFLGVLEDYQAFEDVSPSFRLVLKHWHENGNLAKISKMSVNDNQWKIDVSNIIHQTQSEGFQKEVVSDLLHKLLLGMGIIDYSFDWNSEFCQQEKTAKESISTNGNGWGKTSTSVSQPEKKENFFSRLFGRKDSPSAEECYQNAVSAKSNGNNNDYIEWLKKAAQKGSKDACLDLGQYYYRNSPAQDYGEAVKWFKKGVANGNLSCSVKLGFMYAYGQGVVKDYNIAISYFEKPAKNGNRSAQFGMGFCNYHLMVQSLKKNQNQETEDSIRCYKEAKRWLTYVAEAGNADAQYYLGVVYNGFETINGNIPTYKKESFKWLEQARKQGHKGADEYIKRFGRYYWFS